MRIFYTELYLFLCYLVFGNTTKYTNIDLKTIFEIGEIGEIGEITFKII